MLQRGDDREETVQRRLEVYRAQTEPVLAFYEGQGTRVVHVEGEKNVDDVQAQLVDRLTT